MSLWNYTIDDASPYVSYSPYGDSPTAIDGWRTWYTGSHYFTSPDQASQGDSYHITSSRNASTTFQFFGTGIALFGVTNSSFDIIIDKGPRTTIAAPTSSNSLLYSTQKLTNELHSVTLSAQPTSAGNLNQSLAFDFAIASTPLDNDESSPLPIFYNSNNTTSFAYSGDWAPQTQSGVPNATVTAPFYQTTQVNASVSFSFSGANAIVVKGLASSANGMYSVSLDGQTNIFNGTSMWIIPDALLYFRAGLDPTSTHQLNITNLSSRLCLNSITVFKHELRNATISPSNTSGNTTSSPHQVSSTHIGVIAGPVAGCVLLLIALGFFFWFRRRRRAQGLYMPGAHGKLSFSNPKPRPIVPPRPPSDIMSPMLATFSQEDRSISDVRSTYTSSDVHSSTNLLKGSASHGRRSVRSNTSSDNALSISNLNPMGSFAGWEPAHGMHVPPMPSQYSHSDSSSHRSGPSLGSSSQLSDRTQTTRRLTVETSVSSLSEFGSPRRRIHGQTSAPDYVPMSPRGPLPHIPVPSYDAAMQAPELSPDEVKDMASLRFGEHDAGQDDAYSSRRARRYSALTALTAPPQYEQ